MENKAIDNRRHISIVSLNLSCILSTADDNGIGVTVNRPTVVTYS